MTVRAIIVGAGCAGLSVAVELERQLGERLQLQLVDPRQEFADDRTWCSWGTVDHAFRDGIVASWSDWRVNGPNGSLLQHSSSHPYECLPARNFYRRALELLDSPRHSWSLGHGVDSIDVTPTDASVTNAVTVHGGEQTWTGDLVFDSRPMPRSRQVGAGTWTQSFVGLFVELETAPRTSVVPTLVDVVPRDGHPLHFIYALPFSERSWLVESTWIGPDDCSPEEATAAAEAWVHEHLGSEFTVIRTEQGSIPMHVPSIERTDHVVPIGTRGGSIRGSSGYAFASIQRDAQRIASAVARGRPLHSVPPLKAWHRWLDAVFLEAIERNPERASEWFLRLFEQCGSDGTKVAKFLGGSGTVLSDLELALKMPWAPFIRAALRVGPRAVLGSKGAAA